MADTKKKRHRLLIVSLSFLFLAVSLLYIMDRYVFQRRSKVHLTNRPEILQEKPGYEEDLIETELKTNTAEKEENIEKPEIKPVKPKLKTIPDIMTVLSVDYDRTEQSDWRILLDRTYGKKLDKAIYSKQELFDWDVDMHGETNAQRLSKGTEEFLKKTQDAARENTVEEELQELREELPVEEGVEGLIDPSPSPSPSPSPTEQARPQPVRIDPYSYEVIRFMPGYKEGGYFEDYAGIKFKEAASGPPDLIDDGRLQPEELRGSYLPLGHGGTIVYEIKGGELIDRDGPEFVIYGDSVFTDAVETAKVEVAMEDDPSSYEEFPCDSVNSPFMSCAGVHPVNTGRAKDPLLIGGDAFDLAKIGVRRARFIKITDTGDNKNSSDFSFSAGFDLDSIALIHAYKEQ
jgi:hypothetical protein